MSCCTALYVLTAGVHFGLHWAARAAELAGNLTIPQLEILMV